MTIWLMWHTSREKETWHGIIILYNKRRQLYHGVSWIWGSGVRWLAINTVFHIRMKYSITQIHVFHRRRGNWGVCVCFRSGFTLVRLRSMTIIWEFSNDYESMASLLIPPMHDLERKRIGEMKKLSIKILLRYQMSFNRCYDPVLNKRFPVKVVYM